jgi:hypothetical protein
MGKGVRSEMEEDVLMPRLNPAVELVIIERNLMILGFPPRPQRLSYVRIQNPLDMFFSINGLAKHSVEQCN